MALAVAGVLALVVATLADNWTLTVCLWALVLIGAAYLATVTAAPRRNVALAVVDLETTGLSAGEDRVLEVAVIHTDGNGVIEGSHSWLVRPDDGAHGGEEIHHISEADLAGAPTFAEVANEVAGALSGRILVAHNAAFDAGFLAAEFGRIGGDRPLNEVAAGWDGSAMCTARLARTIGLRPLRLVAVCEQLGVDGPANAHRATDDALACARTVSPLLDRTGLVTAEEIRRFATA